MRFKIFLIFMVVAFSCLAGEKKVDPQEQNARKKLLYETLNQELEVATMLSQQRGHNDPVLLHRIIEAKLQVLKLTKEKEDKEYLLVPPDERAKHDKKYFFKTSYDLYKSVGSLAEKTVNKFKKFKGIEDLFLSMASTAIEFDDRPVIEPYLQNAILYSVPESNTRYAAYGALGDYYYNEKKFREAIEIYEKLLVNTKYEWWGKYAFNNAWCLLKVDRIDESIKLLKTVVTKKPLKGQIDYSEEALKQAYMFFVLSMRIEEGVSFIAKNSRGTHEHLVRLAKLAMGKGYFDPGYSALKVAGPIVQNDRAKFVDLKLTMLELFHDYSKSTLFNGTALVLKNQYFLNKKMKKDEVIRMNDALKKQLDYIQQFLANRPYDKNVQSITEKVTATHTILGILIGSDKKYKRLYHFLRGEMNFYTGDNLLAIKSYYTGYKIAAAQLKQYVSGKLKLEQLFDVGEGGGTVDPKQALEEFCKKSADAMLASLGKDDPKKIDDKYYLATYRIYLRMAPADEKSRLIYPRLFNLYFNDGKVDKGGKVAYMYRKYFPADGEDQRAMVVKVMDYYQQKKDIKLFVIWVTAVDKGAFEFKKDYIDKSVVVLGKMSFIDNMNSLTTAKDKGQKEKGLANYISYFENKRFSPDVRQNSARNASLLYLELGDTPNSVKWMSMWFGSLDKTERVQQVGVVNSSIHELFLRNDFALASKLSKDTYEATCLDSYPEKDEIFKKAVLYRYAANDFDGTVGLLSHYKDCQIKQKNTEMLVKEITEQNVVPAKSENFLTMKKSFGVEHNLLNYFLELEFDIYLLSLDSSDNALATKLETDLLDSKDEKVKSYFIAKKLIESFDKETKVQLEFPQEKFHEILQGKINKLQELSGMVVALANKGHQATTILGYYFLTRIYSELADEVDKFVPPVDDKEFLASYRENMANLINPLRERAKSFVAEGRALASKNEILSIETYRLLPKQKNLPFDIKFASIYEGIFMDRVGVTLTK